MNSGTFSNPCLFMSISKSFNILDFTLKFTKISMICGKTGFNKIITFHPQGSMNVCQKYRVQYRIHLRGVEIF